MDKKGNMVLSLIIILGSVIVFIFILINVVNPPKQLTQEEVNANARNAYLSYHREENQFCESQGLELKSTYEINNCQIVECKNITGIATYNFCNSKDGDGSFLGGLLVGWLVFSK